MNILGQKVLPVKKKMDKQYIPIICDYFALRFKKGGINCIARTNEECHRLLADKYNIRPSTAERRVSKGLESYAWSSFRCGPDPDSHLLHPSLSTFKQDN